MAKKIGIVVRLTPQEHVLLSEAASQDSRSKNSFIVSAIIEKAKKIKCTS